MASGLTNPNMVVPHTANQTFSDAGYLVQLAADGGVVVCTAGATPFGYTFTSTYAPTAATYISGGKVGICGFVPGTEVYYQLGGATAAIPIGSLLAPTASGCVMPIRAIASGYCAATYCVGIAKESKAANATGTIKASVAFFYVAAGGGSAG